VEAPLGLVNHEPVGPAHKDGDGAALAGGAGALDYAAVAGRNLGFIHDFTCF
jgi:hypothetical protein